ncbi:hypothetical protein DFJ74DRAFT_651714 [Hyaloraphidium curvatum]|nr:hypothetical protein DFJ74DRAFT_651714 [Hyaloraphidium curvatum]
MSLKTLEVDLLASLAWCYLDAGDSEAEERVAPPLAPDTDRSSSSATQRELARLVSQAAGGTAAVPPQDLVTFLRHLQRTDVWQESIDSRDCAFTATAAVLSSSGSDGRRGEHGRVLLTLLTEILGDLRTSPAQRRRAVLLPVWFGICKAGTIATTIWTADAVADVAALLAGALNEDTVRTIDESEGIDSETERSRSLLLSSPVFGRELLGRFLESLFALARRVLLSICAAGKSPATEASDDFDLWGALPRRAVTPERKLDVQIKFQEPVLGATLRLCQEWVLPLKNELRARCSQQLSGHSSFLEYDGALAALLHTATLAAQMSGAPVEGLMSAVVETLNDQALVSPTMVAIKTFHAAFESAGMLSLLYPQVTKRMMDAMREFAVTPSPVFARTVDRTIIGLLRQGCARNTSLVLKNKGDANFTKALVYSLVHILYSKEVEVGMTADAADPRRISYENILAVLTDVACRTQSKETIELVISSICRRLDASSGPPDTFALSKLADVAAATNSVAAAKNIALLFTSVRKRHDSADFRIDLVMCRCMLTIARRCSSQHEIVRTMVEKALAFCVDRIMSHTNQDRRATPEFARDSDFAALIRLLGDVCSVAPLNPLLWPADQVLLFRDFWLAMVTIGLGPQGSWPHDWTESLLCVARASPPLVVQETLTNLETDLSSNSVLRRKFSENATSRLRSALSTSLPSCAALIKPLDDQLIAFVAAAVQVESMRMRYPGSIEPLLRYVSSVGTFAPATEPLVETVTQQILALYVKHRSQPGADLDSVELENDVECLIVASASRLGRVRDWAGKALGTIGASFPFIFFSRRLLHTILEILLSLSSGAPPSFETRQVLKELTLYLDTPDRRSHRDEIRNAYRLFTQQWLVESYKFAPELTAGAVQVGSFCRLKLPSTNSRSCTKNFAMGVALASDEKGGTGPGSVSALMTGLGLNEPAAMRNETLAKVTYRLGEVLSDRKRAREQDWRDVSRDLDGSYTANGTFLSSADAAPWVMERAACLLIASRKHDLHLLRAVAWIPLRTFSASSLSSASLFWNSLIAARPELESALLAEFAKAWEALRRNKAGPFGSAWSASKPTMSPMMFTPSRSTPRRSTSGDSPGVIWLRFLSSRLHASIWENSSLQGWYQKLIQMGLESFAEERIHHIDKRALSLVLQSATLLLEAHARSQRRWSVSATALEQYLWEGVLAWLCRMSGGIDYFQPDLEIEAADFVALMQPFINFQSSDAIKQPLEVRPLRPMAQKQSRLMNLVFDPIGSSKRSDLLTLVSQLALDEVERLGAWIDPLRQRKAPTIAGLQVSEASPDLLDVCWTVGPQAVLEVLSRFRTTAGQFAGAILGSLAGYAVEPDVLGVVDERMGAANSKIRLALRTLTALTAIPPISALALLTRTSSPWLLQYCARTLSHYSTDSLFFYVPQFVQALRRDRLRYIEEFILETGHASQLFAHQIIWNMNANMFKDDDSKQPDPILKPACDRLIEKIVETFSVTDREFYEREFSFFNEVTGISGKLRPYIKKSKLEKKHKIDEELQKIKVQPGVYLPSNPDSIVVDIDYDSGRPLQSHAKAPFLATFYATQRADSSIKGRQGHQAVTKQSAIFKVGDDCRQDVLALQLIAMFKSIFEWHGLDLYLFPYRVVATAPGCGVIDVIPNAISRDQMGREKVNFLYDYFLSKYGNPDSLGFLKARSAFVQSLAPYSVILYILQIKDRHNGNIMFDQQGHILHIDFGFIFDIAPGGIRFESAPFKLTTEMVSIMGGSPAAEPYQWFAELCVRSFLACRRYAAELLQMVELMIPSELPCFKGKTIPAMLDRFQLQLSERGAADHMLECIRQSNQNTRTVLYDEFQRWQNQIPYHR